MKKIVHSPDIKNILKENLINTNICIDIISAFIKLNALKFVDENIISSNLTKRVLVRFQLKDLINDATDIELFEYAQKNGWDLYINLKLHSKIYTFDKKNMLLGSSNLTNSGIGIKEEGNIESVILCNISSQEYIDINKLFEDSRILDKKLFCEMRKHFEEFSKSRLLNTRLDWPKSILDELQPDLSVLWVTDFPFSSSPFFLEEHDINLYNKTKLNNIEDIRNEFISSKAYKWLKLVIISEMYFGELTSLLHNVLIDDPRPYRKDVKLLLSNLLNWIIELEIEEFVVDRPNYSQRVSRIYNQVK
ncbi:phospholipase D-like domain-containing protein [Paenibacillus sp. PsM32]|uniref:phospholipase D-like domain-containing protein n=1 Tax=Paenibacillus sp. PsM32 TaxID=3030536 RepID=UPI00263A7CCC|nr:phospholipase D-like domain-containing protein [Paenibacillus sp. PsM32]MDN4617409.1 phospholipase D-like domain-containing protein [Paenibacillus sp. PsM32]